MSENKQSKILQQQKALLDAIESMDKGDAKEEEWRPSLDVVYSIREDIERERARRSIITVSPQVPPGRRLLAVLRQPLPIIPQSLLLSINTPEYERKEE